MLIGSAFISMAEVDGVVTSGSFEAKVITDFETGLGIRVTPVLVAITDVVAIALAIVAGAINVCIFFE